MPKKTHCFDRNKSEYMTIINTKKGQRILGQDSSATGTLKKENDKHKDDKKMAKRTKAKSIIICDECGSEYYLNSSKMTNLCPECSHILYGYENCNHNFESGRCLKCFWNGNTSDYSMKLKNED